MADSETLTIPLPVEAADTLRTLIRQGIFQSESDAIASVPHWKEASPDFIAREDAWKRTEIPKRLAALDSGQAAAIPLAQVMDRFRARRAA